MQIYTYMYIYAVFDGQFLFESHFGSKATQCCYQEYFY